MHTGGIVGLNPSKMPTIRQKGGEVLSAGDPRNSLNGGAPCGQPKLGVIDLREFLSQVVSSRIGEQAFLNLVNANRRTISSNLAKA
jgi:hypothetical protein